MVAISWYCNKKYCEYKTMAKIKPEYKINKKTEIFIKLLYGKGYIVSEILNGSFKNKPYNTKPIKYDEKLIKILLLKKPKDVRIFWVRKYANPNFRYTYINLKTSDNNELCMENLYSALRPEFVEIYREAEFFENIQFW